MKAHYLSPVQVQVRRRIADQSALASLADFVDMGDGGAANIELAGLGFFDKIAKAVGGIFGGGGDGKTEVVVQAPAPATQTQADAGIFGSIASLLGVTVLERVLDRFLPAQQGVANSQLPANSNQFAAPTVWAGAPITSPKPSTGFQIDGKTLAIGGAIVVAAFLLGGRRR